MIYITGDTHGDILPRLEQFEKQYRPTKDDKLIILGDFGVIWHEPNSIFYTEDEHAEMQANEKYKLDVMSNKPYEILFIAGNHECLNSISDILTELGWMNIVDVYEAEKPIKIATYDMDSKQILYKYPFNKIKTYSEFIIDIIGHNYRQSVTLNHDVLFDSRKTKAENLVGKEIKESQLKCEVNNNRSCGIPYNYIKILTCIVMDGTVVDYSIHNEHSKKIRIQFHLKKLRKVEYIIQLLDAEDIPHTVRYYVKDSSYYICIFGDYGREFWDLLHHKKCLPCEFGDMSLQEFECFIEALENTDGSRRGNLILWTSTSKHDVDIVQQMCLMNNYECNYTYIKNPGGYISSNKKPQYRVRIGQKPCSQKLKINKHEYNDYAYCFDMGDTGTLITRYEGGICITGNCHERLNQYPIAVKYDNIVHKITDNVYHLITGKIYDIENQTFFIFGGARSQDIWNIVDPKSDRFWEIIEKLDRKGEFYRVLDTHWWEAEVPSPDEYLEAYNSLQDLDWRVDYILSHDGPFSDIQKLYKDATGTPVSKFLQYIQDTTEYKMWYYGHHHINKMLSKNTQCLYSGILPLGDYIPVTNSGDIIEDKGKTDFTGEMLDDCIRYSIKEKDEVHNSILR